MGKNGTKDMEEKYMYKLINNFIKNDKDENYSICREERQYALYLHNVLFKNKKKPIEKLTERDVSPILSACGFKEGDVIQEVFYEASFMRDFFWRDRWLAYSEKENLKTIFSNKSYPWEKKEKPYIEAPEKRFNYLLLEYVLEYVLKNDRQVAKEEIRETKKILLRQIIEKDIEMPCGLLDLNLGRTAGQKRMKETINELRKRKEKDMANLIDMGRKYVKVMMNIKPDIAVIYSRGEQEEKNFHLRFLECKFESPESDYKSIGKTQTDVQDMVADFLCKKIDIRIDDSKEKIVWKNKIDKSIVVRFIRNEEILEEPQIEIKDLIKENNKIFE